jgi:peptidoglycan/LPS O-acetylase OafA/YrhL
LIGQIQFQYNSRSRRGMRKCGSWPAKLPRDCAAGLLASLARNRPFVAAADASCSIYLVHPIVFMVASALVSKLSPPIWSEEPIRVACFVVILAVSLFGFRYFETPMIRFGNGLARRLDGAQDRAITLVPLD